MVYVSMVTLWVQMANAPKLVILLVYPIVPKMEASAYNVGESTSWIAFISVKRKVRTVKNTLTEYALSVARDFSYTTQFALSILRDVYIIVEKIALNVKLTMSYVMASASYGTNKIWNFLAVMTTMISILHLST